MEYELIFDISKTGIGAASFALPGFLFIALGFALLKFYPTLAKFSVWSEKWARRFAKLFLGFAIFWTITALLSTGLAQFSARLDYARGNYQIIEGIVRNFDPMPASGHKMESFDVDGIKFEYSDYRVTPGFNNATSKGGPIQEGLPV